MNPEMDLEDRLRTALHAGVAEGSPDDGSLDTIRARAHAARRRRRALLAGAGLAGLVAVALVVPRLGDDGNRVTTSHGETTTSTTTEPPSTSTTTEPPSTSSTTEPRSTSTTETPTTVAPPPAVDLDRALWPDPSGELFADPVAVTRSFVEEVIGVDDPPLSEFRALQPDVGEVAVFRRGEDGSTLDRVASTVVVRQLDGEHWFVTSAASEDVIVELPDGGADAVSPVRIAGRGHGFEGTIVVELRERSAAALVLAREATIAGGAAVPAPFSVELAFDPVPAPQIAVLVARDDPGADPGIPSFTAQTLRLRPGGDAGSDVSGT